MKIRRVLLVCSGNTCRSPMAAAILRHLWEQASPGWDLEVSSAGTSAIPGLKASEHAVQAVRRWGLDLSGHRSRGTQDVLLRDMDLILTMTARHKEQLLSHWPDLAGRIFTLGEYAGTNQDVPDPFGGPLSAYEQTASSLEAMLQKVVERIRREGTEGQ